MKSDSQIEKDVRAEIASQPLLDGCKIDVCVKDGIVTLSGKTNSCFKKLSAERAVKKVSGVKALAEDLQVGAAENREETNDTELAAAILKTLEWHPEVPVEKITIKVEDGFVTLEGEVDWRDQYDQAQAAIEHLEGVRSVTNLLSVKKRATSEDIVKKISNTFRNSATLDASRIKAKVIGSTVVLEGTVRSLAEKEDAESAAWTAVGITNVDNQLEIKEEEYSIFD